MATTTQCPACKHTVPTTEDHACPGLPFWKLADAAAFAPAAREDHKIMWSSELRTCDRCQTVIDKGHPFLGQLEPFNGRLVCVGCRSCAEEMGLMTHTTNSDEADLIWQYVAPRPPVSPRDIAGTLLEAFEQGDTDIEATDGYASFDAWIDGHCFRVHIQRRS